MVAISKGNTINRPSIKTNSSIKGVGSSGNKIDNIDVIDANNTESVKMKLAKSNNLI